MCLAIFLTRLPWIAAGYGTDHDAYWVINAARHIAQTGEYIASRLPGFPVYEYLMSSTPAKVSPLFSNGLTAVFSCIAFLFFALILRQFRVRQYLLLASAFALTPVVYVYSTNTMDCMFATAFALGSTYFVLVHRPFVAGICLGLAIGCRITSGAMLLPLALWMFLEERTLISGKRFLIISTTALMIGGICFLPVVHHYGLGFFTRQEPVLGYPSVSSLLKRGVLQVWGVPGTLGLLALCCLVPFISQHIRVSLMQPHVRRALVLTSLVVVLYVVAFLSHPFKAVYLIPAVPFLLLSVGLLIPPYFVRWFAMLLILSSFFTIDSSGVTLSGPIRVDHWARVSLMQETRKILEAVARLPENAVIVAGRRWPRVYAALSDEYKDNHLLAVRTDDPLETLLGRAPVGQHHGILALWDQVGHNYHLLVGSIEYVGLIKDADTYRRYIEQGRTVYFLSGVDGHNLYRYGVDLKHLGAQQLDALDEK
jgi:hypothetical protein